MDSGRRECFTCLAMCVDLRKPLVSKVWINGKLQRVEYDGLPSICFKCGRVGHASVGCVKDESTVKINTFKRVNSMKKVSGLEKRVVEESYGS